MKLYSALIILFFGTMLLSCKNKTEESEILNAGLIEITKAQFKSENMMFGEQSQNPFYEIVNFTGTIEPSVKGMAQISLPMAGIITKIYCTPGQSVSKGALLFEVSGNEFIDIQKDFAESSAVLKRLKSDYDRINELYKDNIGTKKEFIIAESAFYAEQAKYNALKIKLQNMGLDVSLIEKGTFFSTYSVRSTLNGFVTNIDATMGQFIEPQQNIAEIIDAGSFQLKLFVFEKNINKVKVGQAVSFNINGNEAINYSAKIISVGKVIMNDSKSIECYAKLDNLNSMTFVNNQYTEGEIYLAEDSVLSLPQSAIIKSEDNNYILILEKETDEAYFCKEKKVAIDRTSNGFVEVIDQLPDSKILVKGTYNLQVE